MAKNWWFKFDFRVWRTDSDLRECTLETKGFWVELLCVMHEKDVYEITGSYERLSRLMGCSTNEVARCVVELKDTKTADVTLGHGEVTIKSRRLERELNARESNRLRKRKERSHSGVTTQSKSNKKEVINKEGNKKKKATATATDSEWLSDLKTKAAYKRLDVDIEFDKAQTWADTNNRQCTRRFFVGWLNRAQPMNVKTNGNGVAQVGKFTGNEKEYNCPTCFDLGTITNVIDNLNFKEMPCPKCAAVRV